MPRPEPILALATALSLALAAPAGAQQALRAGTAKQELQQLEGRLKAGQAEQRRREAETARLQRELGALQRQLIAAAAETQETEAALTEAEARVRELAGRIYARHAALETRRDELTGTLAALVRLQRRPAALLLVQGGTAVDAARASRLLSLTATRLDEDARQLGRELDDMVALRATMEEQRAALDSIASRLQDNRVRLSGLVADAQQRRGELQRQHSAASRRLTVLTGKAKDLRSLLRRLDEAEAARQRQLVLQVPPPPDRPAARSQAAPAAPALAPQAFASARGRLAMPAQGRLIKRFGQDAETGLHERGVTLLTRAEAQVVAPFDGRIVFSGPFRHYGLVLIIAHSEGYHTLLAGLARTYVQQGHQVLAGEPVGQMGRGNGKTRTLYVELRRRGEAIDPRSWWAQSGRKVSG